MKYTHEELLSIRSYKELRDKHPFIYNKIIEERSKQLKFKGLNKMHQLEVYPTNMISNIEEGGFSFYSCKDADIRIWQNYLQPLEYSNISGDYRDVYNHFNTTYEKETNVSSSIIKNRFAQIKF